MRYEPVASLLLASGVTRAPKGPRREVCCVPAAHVDARGFGPRVHHPWQVPPHIFGAFRKTPPAIWRLLPAYGPLLAIFEIAKSLEVWVLSMK